MSRRTELGASAVGQNHCSTLNTTEGGRRPLRSAAETRAVNTRSIVVSEVEQTHADTSNSPPASTAHAGGLAPSTRTTGKESRSRRDAGMSCVRCAPIARASTTNWQEDERMKTPPIVSPKDWNLAREELLAKEKELTRARD